MENIGEIFLYGLGLEYPMKLTGVLEIAIGDIIYYFVLGIQVQLWVLFSWCEVHCSTQVIRPGQLL